MVLMGGGDRVNTVDSGRPRFYHEDRRAETWDMQQKHGSPPRAVTKRWVLCAFQPPQHGGYKLVSSQAGVSLWWIQVSQWLGWCLIEVDTSQLVDRLVRYLYTDYSVYITVNIMGIFNLIRFDQRICPSRYLHKVQVQMNRVSSSLRCTGFTITWSTGFTIT